MAALLGIIKNALVETNELFITFKQAQYWEGDVVEGQVTLISLDIPYKVQIEVIVVSIAQASLSEDNSKHVLKIKPEAILTQKIRLFEGEITQREHSFEFQFILPNVLYYVSAILQVPYRFDMDTSESFDVFEKQKKLATPQRAYTLTSNNKMTVWIDRNMYCPGDQIIVRLKMAFIESPIVHVTIVQGIESQETKHIYYVANHVSQFLGSFPEHYYGVTWIKVAVPTNLPPSTSLGAVRRLYFLKVEAGRKKRITVLIPISILAEPYVNTLHPIASPTAPVPPPCSIRPKKEPSTLPNCSLCGVEFSLLRGRTHCMHCGKVFCKSCVNTKVIIPNLEYNKPENVCRPCARIVEETGGIKYSVPSKILAEWVKANEPEWVPRSSKRDYAWIQAQVQNGEYICFAAKDPVRYPWDMKPGEFSLDGNKVWTSVNSRKNGEHMQNYM